MNKKQRVILIVAAVLFALTGLFPPWIEKKTLHSRVRVMEASYHHEEDLSGIPNLENTTLLTYDNLIRNGQPAAAFALVEASEKFKKAKGEMGYHAFAMPTAIQDLTNSMNTASVLTKNKQLASNLRRTADAISKWSSRYEDEVAREVCIPHENTGIVTSRKCWLRYPLFIPPAKGEERLKFLNAPSDTYVIYYYTYYPDVWRLGIEWGVIGFVALCLSFAFASTRRSLRVPDQLPNIYAELAEEDQLVVDEDVCATIVKKTADWLSVMNKE